MNTVIGLPDGKLACNGTTTIHVPGWKGGFPGIDASMASAGHSEAQSLKRLEVGQRRGEAFGQVVLGGLGVLLLEELTDWLDGGAAIDLRVPRRAELCCGFGGVFGVGFLREYIKSSYARTLEQIREHHADHDPEAVDEFLARFEAADVAEKGDMLREMKAQAAPDRLLAKQERRGLGRVHRVEVQERLEGADGGRRLLLLLGGEPEGAVQPPVAAAVVAQRSEQVGDPTSPQHRPDRGTDGQEDECQPDDAVLDGQLDR